MYDFFKALFAYHDYCTQQLYEMIAETPEPIPEQTNKLCSHILNAHHIWNCRILGKQRLYDVWSILSPQEMIILHKDNMTDTQFILDNWSLDATVHYQNSRGAAFEGKVSDILFHIINHATYHRGQIAIDCRQHGLASLLTDYIFYKRQ